MASPPPVRFAAIGLNHAHIYAQVNLLLRAGAECAGFFAAEPELAGPFAAAFPGVPRARTARELLEDPRHSPHRERRHSRRARPAGHCRHAPR